MKKIRSPKRILALLLSVIMVVSISLPVSAASNPFTDVSSGAWYAKAVAFVYEKGIFNGTSKTTFSPNMGMTRGMFVTAFGNAMGIDKSQYTGASFFDVSQSAYYAPYVKWAKEKGYVSGTGNNNFSPNAQISRQDMVTIFFNFVKNTKGKYEINEQILSMKGFKDTSSISNYALTPMRWAVTNGIIAGDNNKKLNPKQTLLRSECAQVFYNGYDIIFGGSVPDLPDNPAPVTPSPAPTPKPTPDPNAGKTYYDAKSREVWIVTEAVWIEYDVPQYSWEEMEICAGCNQDLYQLFGWYQNPSSSEYVAWRSEHKSVHMKAGEYANSWTEWGNVVVGYKDIAHDEEGYWEAKTVYAAGYYTATEIENLEATFNSKYPKQK